MSCCETVMTPVSLTWWQVAKPNMWLFTLCGMVSLFKLLEPDLSVQTFRPDFFKKKKMKRKKHITPLSLENHWSTTAKRKTEYNQYNNDDHEKQTEDLKLILLHYEYSCKLILIRFLKWHNLFKISFFISKKLFFFCVNLHTSTKMTEKLAFY